MASTMESTENKEVITTESTPAVTPVTADTTTPYSGWLVSNTFYKRVLAVAGHYLVGSLVITLSLSLIGFVVMVLASLVN